MKCPTCKQEMEVVGWHRVCFNCRDDVSVIWNVLSTLTVLFIYFIPIAILIAIGMWIGSRWNT